MHRWLSSTGHGVLFALRVVVAMPGALLRPSFLSVQFAHLAWGMLPIVLVVGLALGMVTWMHVGHVLMRFESQPLLPALLMMTVVMEFGPLTVGLISAGRLGSGIAAELAALEVTEQLDALDVMGVSPIRRLVAPRVLACAILLPALTVVVDYAALVGSYFAEVLGGELSWVLYTDKALEQITSTEAILATGKTIVFGLLVGVISCWNGMHAPRTTEGVGRAATNAVIWSTLAVLLSNIFLVRIIQVVQG